MINLVKNKIRLGKWKYFYVFGLCAFGASATTIYNGNNNRLNSYMNYKVITDPSDNTTDPLKKQIEETMQIIKNLKLKELDIVNKFEENKLKLKKLEHDKEVILLKKHLKKCESVKYTADGYNKMGPSVQQDCFFVFMDKMQQVSPNGIIKLYVNDEILSLLGFTDKNKIADIKKLPSGTDAIMNFSVSEHHKLVSDTKLEDTKKYNVRLFWDKNARNDIADFSIGASASDMTIVDTGVVFKVFENKEHDNS